MKKIIASVLFALSCGALLAEGDMYMYWMVDTESTVEKWGGEAGSISDIQGLYAKVAVDGMEGTYLGLYEQAGSDYYYGKGVQVSEVLGESLPIFANLGDYAGNTFFLELWTAADGGTKEYTSEKISYAAASQYFAQMKNNMAAPAEAYGFKTFTAVPEPTSGLLLLLGVAGLALRRKNKKA